MRLAVVIMAGGRGERLWPGSRVDLPKQFLAIGGGETLLQKTLRRVQGVSESSSFWVATNEAYGTLVREQLPELPSARCLLEPVARDTAACVALSMLHVEQADPDAIMVMLPADHLVMQDSEFVQTLRKAIKIANEGDHLITLGIRPSRPETAYGYIQTGGPHCTGAEAHTVTSFTEKPPLDRAIEYLSEGGYLWNSGIFVWSVKSIKSALNRFLPDLMEALAPLARVLGTPDERPTLERIYPSLPKKSIDYGVMEKADNVLVVPADFGWDDLGTWAALDRVMEPDAAGNVISGNVLTVDTTDSIVHSDQEHRLIVTFGVNDVVVVNTDDVTLVSSKARVSELKTVLGRLQLEGLHQYLRRS